MSEFAAPWGNYMVLDMVPTIAPQLVSFLPQTTAWKILAVVGFLYVARKSYHAWRVYQQNAYRREALSWLSNLPAYSDLKEQPVYRQLPTLLRKTALQAFGREVVSPLSNEHWERWLDQQCDLTSFAQDASNQLKMLAYAREPQLDAQQMQMLFRQISLWIQFHRSADD
jgi:hypothetical protein